MGRRVFIILCVCTLLAVNSCRKGEVCKHEPVPCFTITPPTARINQWVFFNATCSQNTETYTWEFGDGAIGGNDTITKRYSRQGTYQVQLIGHSANCRFQAITKSIIIVR